MVLLPHPLTQLSEAEINHARDCVTKSYGPDSAFAFKSIYLNEPKKAELIPFLELEHAGKLSEDTPRPPRQARVEYDLIGDKLLEYNSAVVDLKSGQIVSKDTLQHEAQPYFTPTEFSRFQEYCVASDLFKEALKEFTLPENFEVIIDPWPYGGLEDVEQPIRYMQGLVFARDSTKGTDSNHYAYPIPLIPVMDVKTREIVRVDRMATGGKGSGLAAAARAHAPKKLFENAKAAEYNPELMDIPTRKDLKPLNVVQPEGASFTIHADGLVEWQKWRFRLGFTPREGAVLHDVCYDNRSIVYRLSYAELTVPYGDPRAPYHRKQAFDLGDGGVGRAANNLELGCDCLGAIHYFNGFLAAADGTATPAKSVICIHEQDEGILWKHTNFRTNRAVVTRNRVLVMQFIVTLANYEYIFNYKLDLAGGLTIETRATGIMSVVAIEGKESDYGNVVAPGILAQNHQHIFAVRIDPAIDSYTDTQVVIEESVGQKMNPKTNPYGNLYTIERETVEKARYIDAEPQRNRVLKLENDKLQNPYSGKNVAYKLINPASQLMLADEESLVSKRAPYARHNTWVTGYRDGELWAAGEFTNQSKEEKGGVKDMVKRGDWFREGGKGAEEGGGTLSSPVVWSVFGFTHNPRVEDWPIMPIEIHQLHLRPADFFSANPALDVPSTRNEASVLVPCCGKPLNGTHKQAKVQEDPLTHLQGQNTSKGVNGGDQNGDQTTLKREGTLKQAFGKIFKSSSTAKSEDV